MRPPLTDPTYSATSRAMACSGVRKKVIGSDSAISMLPVRPGIAPIVTPRNTPTKRIGRRERESTALIPPPKPVIIETTSFIRLT